MSEVIAAKHGDELKTHPTFSVDTHLFRELGELLVGRDSTALVELIKNAYDADATQVEVYGANLDSPDKGVIVITDDGTGMNEEQFRNGFLRVASRFKTEGTPRSSRYERRYTGAKGIGRLAAHKLARHLAIDSIPWEEEQKDLHPIQASIDDAKAEADDGKKRWKDLRPIRASIDWDAVEALSTLDELAGSTAITLHVDERVKSHKKSGTIIQLTRLRRRWTPGERSRFFAEVTSFTPPEPLVFLPAGILKTPLLFDKVLKVRDNIQQDPNFRVKLHGELEAGEEYWPLLAQTADWVIEIDATQPEVRYGIAPTTHGQKAFPQADRRTYHVEREPKNGGPFFQARILIREGVLEGKQTFRGWAGRAAGVRVFMEGFRVLPYGEPGNDWLWIDFDYSRRNKQLNYLGKLTELGEEREEEGLLALRNTSYFGAVFLTTEGAPGLRMLVNREGFVPEVAYEELVRLVRIGIDLSTRVRAQSRVESSTKRSEARRERVREETRRELREAVTLAVMHASQFATEARVRAASGDMEAAVSLIHQASREFELASETSDRLMNEGAILRVLASVGAQMAAFVHEINGLLGTASAVEAAFESLSNDPTVDKNTRQRLARMRQDLANLRRSIERQASYLMDVVSPDARRRRSRQKLAERFDAARRLIEPTLARRSIEVINDIPSDLRTPSMFPAEITVVFSNLLTNAVKAAGREGRIRAWAVSEGAVVRLYVENTGVAVSSDEGERWFLPFASTTIEVDPVLGQGMGMGLPITRNLLAEYGVSIRFTRPSPGYATALEIIFPD